MMKFKAVSLIPKALIISFCLGLLPVSAPNSFAEEVPITITADEMMSTEKSSSVTFTGDVDAKQGDLRIRSDKMTVFYSAPDKSKSTNVKQQVDKILCKGNVEITREDWLGTSKEMTYLADKKEIYLTGNAKFWQGQNMVAGEKIVYYMNEGRSEVLGGDEKTTTVVGGEKKKKRVNMTIIQQ